MTRHFKNLSLFIYNLHHKGVQLIYFLSQMGQALCSARGSCYAISCISVAGCELEWETDKSVGFGSLKSS